MKIIIDDNFADITIKYEGKEYNLEFGHHDVSMWSLTEAFEDVWESSLLRGKFKVNTNRTTVLKKCIDKLLEGEKRNF